MLETIKVNEQGNQVFMDKVEFEQFIDNVDSLAETVEILSSPEMIKQIQESKQDILHSRLNTISSDGELKNLLGIQNV